MSAATNASNDWERSIVKLPSSGLTCVRSIGSVGQYEAKGVNGMISLDLAGPLKSSDLQSQPMLTSHQSTSSTASMETAIVSTRIIGEDIEIGKAGFSHPAFVSPDIVSIGDISIYSRDLTENTSKEIPTMSNGFLKLIRSDLLIELFKKPNAFTLLAVIAYRARRTDCPITGLKKGEAMIGDFLNYGMSRQQYRTALEHLEMLKLVTNRATIKTTNGATIRATNRGMIVKIIDTRVYDINIEDGNQQSNQQSNQQKNPRATTNKKKEDKKEDKKEEKKEGKRKRSTPHIKIAYREKVLLTEAQHKALDELLGPQLDSWLDKIENYKQATGKNYESDYHAVRKWLNDDQAKCEARPKGFADYSNQSEIDRMAAEVNFV